MSEEGGFEGTREELDKVIGQLNALEYILLGGAMLLALGGGAAVAFLLSAGTELPFRATWAVLSLLLLTIPGAIVLGRERRRTRRGPNPGSDHPKN